MGEFQRETKRDRVPVTETKREIGQRNTREKLGRVHLLGKTTVKHTTETKQT